MKKILLAVALLMGFIGNLMAVGAGEGVVTRQPTTAFTSATGIVVGMTLTAGATAYTAGGFIQIDIPAGWSAPSLTSTDPGYVSAVASTTDIGDLAITVSGQSVTIVVSNLAATIGTVSFYYGSKDGGGAGATAPATVGAQTFTWKTAPDSTGLAVIAAQPVITLIDHTLTVEKSVDVAHIEAGVRFTYSMSVTCTGQCYDVEVWDSIPTGFVGVNGAPTPVITGGVWSWFYLGLTNSSEVITLWGSIAAYSPENVTNMAEVKGSNATYDYDRVVIDMATPTITPTITKTATKTITQTITPALTSTYYATQTQVAALTMTATQVHGTIRKTQTAIAVNTATEVAKETKTAIYIEDWATRTPLINVIATATEVSARKTATAETIASLTPTLTPTAATLQIAKSRAIACATAGNMSGAVANYAKAVAIATVAKNQNEVAWNTYAQGYVNVAKFKTVSQYTTKLKTIRLMTPNATATAYVVIVKATVVAGEATYLQPAETPLAQLTPLASYSVVKNRKKVDTDFIAEIRAWIAAH